MRRKLSIKKGFDLRLSGSVVDQEGKLSEIVPRRIAVTPDDFLGLTLKAAVKDGEDILAGQPLLYDKNNPAIKVASPVTGRVDAVVRGERRKIERIVVSLDNVGKSMATHSFSADNDAKVMLMESGLWAFLRQRPFDIVPSPDTRPRDIFVTAIDTAPLATSLLARVAGMTDDLARGVDVLSGLTDGRVWIGVAAKDTVEDIPGAVMIDIEGPHPAGNVGVMIAGTVPVNKGEVVWTLDVVTLARIGHLFNKGTVDFSTHVAVTGPEVRTPKLVKTLIGAEIAPLLNQNICDDRHHHRIISGNVLTGIKVGFDSFLRYPYRQLTVIAEGDDTDEFMGWASMKLSKLSVSRSFPSCLLSSKRSFSPDARLLGGRRAMIMSGLYEKVFPMDVLPEFLIKAILSRDIEQMEALGIYEVAPEDFALAEFIDPSKLELQKIVAEGIDFMRKEL